MSSSRSLVAASLALALLPGCDTPRAPRPDLFGTVLRMRQAQTFHAMPPEAPVTLPVRRVSERAAATRADAVAERDTVMPFAVLAAAGRRTLEVGPIEVTLARGDSLPLHALVR
ncbi:MAG TPA: hypothetical protein VEA99_09495, partial [Gemmatimonadaceae bacterium]|nr:hypothetical protein [Gemmatimonadaceae bacterium]